MSKHTLLIISFSPLYRDARLLKQINLFKDLYDITTCGYGPKPVEGIEHIEIPENAGTWDLNGRLITLRQYRQVYWRLAGVKWVWEHLKGKKFDLVLANDYETVPIGVRLRPRIGVHADLHEYAPSQAEENDAWRRRIKPWREWVIRNYVAKASSWTTVCEGIADKFQSEFGFLPSVVVNAAPYVDLSPTPVSEPLRLVHHGVANPSRHLDQMVRAVSAASGDFIFDLYIVGGQGPLGDPLREAAKGDDRIRILEAIPYEHLIEVLNTYDVGVYLLTPSTFNQLHALPNKIFDFVQARLGVIVGPNPEMARLVDQTGIGLVLPDYEEQSLTAAIEGLNKQTVEQWKGRSYSVARELSSETQNEGWEIALLKLSGGSSSQ